VLGCRLVVPGHYAKCSVKWLTEIKVLSRPLKCLSEAPLPVDDVSLFGDQAEAAALGVEVDDVIHHESTRVQPKAIMVLPGLPLVGTVTRVVEKGRVLLSGRAWVDTHTVLSGVEVSTDGGIHWAAAELQPPPARAATGVWNGWQFVWMAQVPGEYEVVCRAKAVDGRVQQDSSEDGWQRVKVAVVDALPPLDPEAAAG